MFCKHCGNEIDELYSFCPNCGGSLKADENVNIELEPQEKKVWMIFAKIGYILGTISVVTCVFFGIVGFEVGIYGIVASALGKKSISTKEKADKGLVMSIIGTVLGIILFFLFYFFMFLLAFNNVI